MAPVAPAQPAVPTAPVQPTVPNTAPTVGATAQNVGGVSSVAQQPAPAPNNADSAIQGAGQVAQDANALPPSPAKTVAPSGSAETPVVTNKEYEINDLLAQI